MRHVTWVAAFSILTMALGCAAPAKVEHKAPMAGGHEVSADQHRPAPAAGWHELARPMAEHGSAYLGVKVAPAGADLRAKMGLPDGVGLLVTGVKPGSPAAAAKLAKSDVLAGLQGQYLINAEQLGVLLRNCKPGQTVQLTVIRKGHREQLQVKLGAREAGQGRPRVIAAPEGRNDLKGEERKAKSETAKKQQDGAQTSYQVRKDGMMIQGYKDNEYALMLRTDRAGHKTLTARNIKQSTVAFEGPVNTPQERAKLPFPVARRLGIIEKNAGN